MTRIDGLRTIRATSLYGFLERCATIRTNQGSSFCWRPRSRAHGALQRPSFAGVIRLRMTTRLDLRVIGFDLHGDAVCPGRIIAIKMVRTHGPDNHRRNDGTAQRMQGLSWNLSHVRRISLQGLGTARHMSFRIERRQEVLENDHRKVGILGPYLPFELPTYVSGIRRRRLV